MESMIMRVLAFIAFLAIALFFLFVEYLDWHGRLEVIQQKHPKLWKIINARVFRLVLLFLIFALLAENAREKLFEEPLVINFPSADPGTKNSEIAQLKAENSALQNKRSSTAKGKSGNSVKTTGTAGDDPEIYLDCESRSLPIPIEPKSHIDIVSLIPTLGFGMDPENNPTAFVRRWPKPNMPIGAQVIECEIENHGTENASVTLNFVSNFGEVSNPKWKVPHEHKVLVEPLDAHQNRKFYLFNKCATPVQTLIPRRATGRFVIEPSDQNRDFDLLGDGRNRSIGLGASDPGWTSTVCD